MQELETRSADGDRREQGAAIVMALLFTIIAAGIVFSGATIMRANQKKTETNFRVNAQATQFARSGLTEALNWFRRQTSQPVLAFEPLNDPFASPPILDTDEPEIGLVREFRIGTNVWGRYEVWKEWEADPNSARLAFRRLYQATDTSLSRGQGTEGNTWRIRSVGYVFVRNDDLKSFDESPNRVLGTVVLETEVKRLRLAPPGQSAMCVADGNSCHINTNGRIRGGSGGAGIFYPQNSGNPTTGPSNQNRVTGTPRLAPSATYDDSPEAVFGLSKEELRSISDIYLTNPDDFPSPLPNYSIVYAEPTSTLSFDASRPLRGTAIVYIDGSVTMTDGNNSLFNGLLYVDGNLTLRAPCELSGAIVCTGNVTIQGSGDYATASYDEDILNAIRLEIGNYRLSGAIRSVLTEE